MWNGIVRHKRRIHILVKSAMNICIFHEMRGISLVKRNKYQIVQKASIYMETGGNVVNSRARSWGERAVRGVAVTGGRIQGVAKWVI